MMSIRNRGTIFLYEKIAQELKDTIYNKKLPEGYRLPSEQELSERFKTSRPTVRRAIEELRREGWLEVLHGKGTFVRKPKKKDIRILDINGYTDGMAKEDRQFSKVIIGKSVRISTDEETGIFQRNQKFKIFELIRGVYEEGKPFSVDYAYFPFYLYPEIDKKISKDISTYHLIREEYGVVFEKAHKSIEFLSSFSNLKVMNFLTNGVRSPLISVKKQIEDNKARIIHYSNFFLLPTLLKFSIDIDIKI